ncbi:MAG TPA: DUF5996 family protein [Candidatus Baltobacteraceae bacterium]|nr:DUF5996 family protein [Candidatus Baltobacteraceae bacterium]
MDRWPVLRYDDWKDTLHTLHMWTQIAGKIRLRLEPLVNHWWNVPLYVSARGLTTSMMTYGDGRSFEMTFDFVKHVLCVDGCDGELARIALEPMSVAAFYERVMSTLNDLDLRVRINPMPSEVPDAVPLDRDTMHASYDRAAAERFWRVLLQADRLCKAFRTEFTGKASPVHFFWGSFDLAFTRFSGRTAPRHPGGVPNTPDWVTREAYSHEVHSVGFWPGGYGLDALFYAYMYPVPDGFSDAPVRPQSASWNTQLREFVLPYEAVRTSSGPDDAVLSFFRSTYEAGATLARWDRGALERQVLTR